MFRLRDGAARVSVLPVRGRVPLRPRQLLTGRLLAGQLVVFFPTNVFVAPGSDTDGTTSPPNEPELPKRKFPLRLSEVFGYLPSESTDYEGDYQETDEALQVTRTHNLRSVSPARSAPVCLALTASHVQYPAMRDRARPGATHAELSPSFSTIVKIKDVSHLTVIAPARSYSSLGKPAVDVARDNARGAIAARDLLLAKIWTTVVAFFESGLPGDAGAGSPRLDSLLAERMLQELCVISSPCGRLWLTLARQAQIPGSPSRYSDSRHHRLSAGGAHSRCARFSTCLGIRHSTLR